MISSVTYLTSLQTFFEELLKEKTIVIPGIFFDINPSHRRDLFHSPCHHFVRLSFGPPLEVLNRGKRPPIVFREDGALNVLAGIDAIANVLKKAKKDGMQDFGHSYKKSVDEKLEPAHV